MRDLMVDFGNGVIKPLLELTDVEFLVIQNYVAQQCLIVDFATSSQDVHKRIEIEKYMRAHPEKFGKYYGKPPTTP